MLSNTPYPLGVAAITNITIIARIVYSRRRESRVPVLIGKHVVDADAGQA